MKAKLYSTSGYVQNRVDALNAHFGAMGTPYDRVDRLIMPGHADSGKYVMNVCVDGPLKADHLVPGPLVDHDPTWPLADFPLLEE